MDKQLKRLKEINARVRELLNLDSLSDEQRTELTNLIGADNRGGERARVEAAIAQLKEQDDAEARAVAVERADAERRRAAEIDRERQANTVRPSGRMTAPDLPTQNDPHAAVVGNLVLAAPDRNGGFRNPREFLASVMDWGRGNRSDVRLEKRMAVGSDEARGSSDPAGGFLLPEGFSPQVMRVDPESDPIGSRTRKVPMALPSLRIPYRVDKVHTSSVSGGLTVTRRPETVAGTASQITLERMAFVAHELFGLSYATEEILTDSPGTFIALLEMGFSDQFTSHLINERLNGTGVGEYQGIMISGCLVSVAKESGQSAATITKENIDKMRSRCWKYGDAIWLVNHDALPQLRSLSQIVGIGGAPVPYLSTDVNGNATLDGRPCVFTEYAKTLGTQGDLILGVWSEYLEGTYQPLQSAESMHVRFVNHERAFKFWMRNAGQCWWQSALTPKNSTATLSPFVVLDTRA